MQDFLAALGLLTILPVPAETTSARPREAIAGFYPWVGWVLGIDAVILVWLLYVLKADLKAAPLLASALVIGYWAVATGGMHLDGLADSFDAIGSRGSRERKLEVMRDPRIGALGAGAMVIVILVQLTAVSAIVSSQALWPLIAAPVLGRAVASIFTWTHVPAREDGLGSATASAGFSVYPVVTATLAVAALLALPWLAEGLRMLGVAGMPVAGALCCELPSLARMLVTAGIAAAVLPRALGRVVGGVTGDLLGASIVLSETAVLVVAALWR